jgi:hypothetical protein
MSPHIKEPQPPKNGFGPALSWALSAAGLAGCLVTLGFIVESAYQNALGVSMQFLAPQSYILSGGTFLLDLLALTLRWCGAHVWWVVAAMVCISVSALTLFRWKWHASQAIGTLILVALAALCIANLVLFDIPTVYLQNLWGSQGRIKDAFGIVTPDKVRRNTLAERRSLDLLRTLVCAHMPRDVGRNNALEAAKMRCGGTVSSLNDLDDFMFGCAGLTAAAILCVIWRSHSRFRSELRRGGLLRTAIIALLAVNVLTVPYLYGKSLRFSGGATAIIYYSPLDAPQKAAPQKAAESPSGAAKKPAVVAPQDGPVVIRSDNSEPPHENGIIAAESDAEVVFLDTNKKGEFWYLPRSKVTLIKVVQPDDILTHLIQDSF